MAKFLGGLSTDGFIDTGLGFRHGSLTTPSWTTGTGTPEGAVTAPIGSMFSRVDGGTDTAVYRKESGAGNTGWVAVTNSGTGGGLVTSVDGRTGDVALSDLYVDVTGDTMTGDLMVNANVASLGGIDSYDLPIRSYTGSLSDPAVETYAYGDVHPRVRITSGGAMNWGPGPTPPDTNLYRSAPDTLRTDDSLSVGVRVDATSGFRHGSSTTPSWTTGLGTPEGVVAAPIGSLFSRVDGSTDTAIYRKETGVGATGWVSTGGAGGAVGTHASTHYAGGSDPITGKLALSYGSASVILGANAAPGTGALTTAVGESAMKAQTSGHSNTAVGQNVLPDLTTGAMNVAIGLGAGAGLAGGSTNILIGPNTAVGGVGGVNGCIAIGSAAQAVSNNIAIGPGVTALHNGAVGLGGSTTANNDFVLGVAAHNVKVPGTLAVTSTVDGSAGFRHGSVTMPSWTKGAGTPEGVVAAPIGSIYSRTDGSTGSAIYRKEVGVGTTGWVAASAAPPDAVTSVDGRMGVVTLADKYVDVTGDTMTGPLKAEGAYNSFALTAAQTGDARPRVIIRTQGLIELGDGVLPINDTNLYRSAANVLKTDDAFEALNLRTASSQTISEQRIAPVVVGDAIDLGSISLNNGVGMVDMALTMDGGANSTTKQYLLPVSFNQTNGAWQLVRPISDAGPNFGQDFALDINMTNATLSLRVRRAQGTTAGTLIADITVRGRFPGGPWISSSTASTPAAPTVQYEPTSISQRAGNLMVGTLDATVINSSAGNQQLLGANDRVLVLNGATGAAVNIESSLPLVAGSVGQRIGSIAFSSTAGQPDAHRQVSGIASRVTAIAGTYSLQTDLGFFTKAGAGLQEVLTLSPTLATITTPAAVGTNPATSGAMRLGNGAGSAINFRSLDNTTNYTGMYLDAANVLQVSGPGMTVNVPNLFRAGAAVETPDIRLPAGGKQAVIGQFSSRSIWPFLSQTWADRFQHGTMSNCEFWNGTAWAALASSTVQEIFSGYPNNTALNSTTYPKWRVTFSGVGASYAAVLFLYNEWTPLGSPPSYKVTLEESADASAWTTLLPETTVPAGPYYTTLPTTISYGNYVRLTIEHVTTGTTYNWREIKFFSDRMNGQGGQPLGLPFTWNYAKTLSLPGQVQATNFKQGASGPTWQSGAGSPEGVIAAPVGSIYSRTDGGADTALYRKETGVAATGWVAVADVFVNINAPTGTPNSGDLWYDSDEPSGLVLPVPIAQGGTAGVTATAARTNLAVPAIGNSTVTAGAPTTGTWARGDNWLDSAGVLWVCTTAGTPGTWVFVGTNKRAAKLVPGTNQFINQTTYGYLPGTTDRNQLKIPFTKRMGATSRMVFTMAAHFYVSAGAAQRFDAAVTNGTNTYDVVSRWTQNAATAYHDLIGNTGDLFGLAAGTYTFEPVFKSATTATFQFDSNWEIAYTVEELP